MAKQQSTKTPSCVKLTKHIYYYSLVELLDATLKKARPFIIKQGKMEKAKQTLLLSKISINLGLYPKLLNQYQIINHHHIIHNIIINLELEILKRLLGLANKNYV